jgi:hypothetical protein
MWWHNLRRGLDAGHKGRGSTRPTGAGAQLRRAPAASMRGEPRGDAAAGPVYEPGYCDYSTNVLLLSMAKAAGGERCRCLGEWRGQERPSLAFCRAWGGVDGSGREGDLVRGCAASMRCGAKEDS